MMRSTPPSKPSSQRVPKGPQLRIACDNCHTSKVRCSGEKTGCARCTGQNWSCVYSPSLRLGKPKGSKNKHQRVPGTSKAIKERRNNSDSLESRVRSNSRSSLAGSDSSYASTSLTSPASHIGSYVEYHPTIPPPPFVESPVGMEGLSTNFPDVYLSAPSVAGPTSGDLRQYHHPTFEHTSSFEGIPPSLYDMRSRDQQLSVNTIIPYSDPPTSFYSAYSNPFGSSQEADYSASSSSQSYPYSMALSQKLQICHSEKELMTSLAEMTAILSPVTPQLDSILSVSSRAVSSALRLLSNSSPEVCSHCDASLSQCKTLIDCLLTGLIEATVAFNSTPSTLPISNALAGLSAQKFGRQLTAGESRALGYQALTTVLQQVGTLMGALKRISGERCMQRDHSNCVHQYVSSTLEPKLSTALSGLNVSWS